MGRFLIVVLIMLIHTALCRADDKASEASLRKHVEAITKGESYRNYRNIKALDRTADYIYKVFHQQTENVFIQAFEVDGKEYKNVYASFGPVNAPRIIIGAHYDVCGDQMGADDNASGVAGLLELARLFAVADQSKWEMRIDLVAYSLEEPPYFDTKNMGSSVHATALETNKTPVVGMISLEMIGYYDDEKGSQDYPIGLMSLFYGSRGDYITVVRKTGSGKFARLFTREFKRKGRQNVRTKVFKAPLWLVPSIDLSDHKNYWKYKWSALMITDTSFYRNKNYHEDTDKPDTLDYFRMSAVVTNVFNAIQSIMS